MGVILLDEPPGYALFLLATVLLHETGHIFAFLICGEPLPLFRGRRLGLLLTPRTPLLSYKKELLICAAGPLFNLLAALALIPALRTGKAFEATFCFLAMNLLTAAFNLLPIDSFDGGRAVAALLSLLLGAEIAARIAAALSWITLFFLYFVGLFLVPLAQTGQIFLFACLLLCGEFRKKRGLFEDL